MRVFIAGIDGYLGWTLAVHLAHRGHEVGGIDALHRRRWVEELGSHSALPIPPMAERLDAYRERFGTSLAFVEGDLTDYEGVLACLRRFRPEAVVHLGEMPSAPYSMMDVAHATWTQTNNIVGTLHLLYAMRATCPEAHLLKLGTMGEYGTPNVPIPEGFFDVEYGGRRDRLPFPRQAGSWYHQSKVHDSHNIMLACRIWKLRSTDVMQGVVYGTRVDAMGAESALDPRFVTRLDFDQCFGTVINRFCCQAMIGHPITPFGSGRQKRGFIALRDSMQCLTLALESPPAAGEYRVLNQFEEVWDVASLAREVQAAGRAVGIDVSIRHLENPRTETEDHYYAPEHQRLFDLGYKPAGALPSELRQVLADLAPHRARIEAKRHLLVPDIRWSGARSPVRFVE
jgi:UDP-sulfoquinovose synthase